MRRKYLIPTLCGGAVLLASAAYAQTGVLVAMAAASTEFPLAVTVAQLPAAGGGDFGVRRVTDGASATDCTVGGGSTILLCLDTGAAWEAVGTGGGGGGAASDVSCTDCVTLGTETDGGYAASVSEGGPATTATALAANGANCSAGSFPLGVDASGAVESCTDAATQAELDTHASGDTHTGYALLAGRAGGQTLHGGTADTENLTLYANAVDVGDGPTFELSSSGSVESIYSWADYVDIGTPSASVSVVMEESNDRLSLKGNGGVRLFSGGVGGTGVLELNVGGNDLVFTGGDVTVGGSSVCREDGTNCPASSGSSSGTGLQYGDGAGGFSEVTGSSVSGANVTLGGRVVLPLGGSVAATPTLAFTDDTGLYEKFANQLFVSLGGAESFSFEANLFSGANSNGPRMANSAASATTPTFRPNKGDSDTGMGHAAADDGRLIAGGSSVLGFARSGSQNTVTIYGALALTPQSAPPVTCGNANTEGVIYSDSDGSKALCWCSGAAWVVVAGPGACS